MHNIIKRLELYPAWLWRLITAHSSAESWWWYENSNDVSLQEVGTFKVGLVFGYQHRAGLSDPSCLDRLWSDWVGSLSSYSLLDRLFSNFWVLRQQHGPQTAPSPHSVLAVDSSTNRRYNQGWHSVACTDFFKGRGKKKGTLACVLAPKRALKCAFWLPRGHFSVCFGSQEGT